LFTVSVQSGFRASHRLSLADGAVEPEHEHNWLVRVTVSGNKLDSMGLVMDFRRLRQLIEEVLGELRGVSLGQIDYFRQNSASAEHVAKYVYEQIEPKLPEGIGLENVTIVEEPGCVAGYSIDKGLAEK